MSKQNRIPMGVEPLWSTFIHSKGSALGLPIAGNFELTTRCNFDCRMCYVHNNDNQGELTAEEWISLGKIAVESGMVFLLLTGGEPFVRKDFKEIYSGLKKLGLLLSINTNASLITDDMLEFLRNDPPLRINVTLYGASNETYKRLCGLAMYDQVAKNIVRLHEAGLQVRLNASITPYNASDIEGIYRFAEEVGLPVKATTYMFPPVRVNGCQYGEAPDRFTPEDAARYMLRCREQYLTPEQLANSWVDDFGDSECTDGQGDHMHCRAGKTAFWVTWDGRMLPCGMFADEGYSIPKMGFSAAWEAVRSHCRELRLPPQCANCNLKSRCTACAASCLTESGSTFAHPEYVCRMTKLLEQMTKEKYGRGKDDHESE